MVVCVHNPCIWEAEQEGLEFKVILGYIKFQPNLAIQNPCLNRQTENYEYHLHKFGTFLGD